MNPDFDISDLPLWDDTDSMGAIMVKLDGKWKRHRCAFTSGDPKVKVPEGTTHWRWMEGFIAPDDAIRQVFKKRYPSHDHTLRGGPTILGGFEFKDGRTEKIWDIFRSGWKAHEKHLEDAKKQEEWDWRWDCDKSPSGKCEYEEDDDSCDHCGEPEERK